jgi:hypothetical protein
LESAFLYDTKTGEAWPLRSPGPGQPPATIRSVVTVEGSPAFLLAAGTAQGLRWYWVDVRVDGPEIEDITALMPARPERVDWDPDERKQLMVLERGRLTRIHVPARGVYPEVAEDIEGLGLAGRALYLLSKDGSLLRASLEGDAREPLMIGDGAPSRWKPYAPLAVTMLSDDTFCLLGQRGALLAGLPPRLLVERGVLGVVRDPERDRAAFWTKNRIGLIEFVRSKDELPPRPLLRWVHEGGRRIDQVLWAHEGTHLVVRDEDQVSLLELETSGTPRLQPVVQVKRRSDIAFVEDTGLLCYVEPAQKELAAIRLVPKEP